MNNVMVLHLVYLIFFGSDLFAHPGRTSRDGCHVCKTNCLKYGVREGVRHSHDGKTCIGKKSGSSKVPTTEKRLEKKRYSRKYFKHWIDVDGDCQNTRDELLLSWSEAPVKFQTKRRCKVVSGRWKDFYYNEVILDASLIDVDHIVPLKNAWESGANKWSDRIRIDFANDYDNLVVTNRSYNRSKGSQTPLTWSPIDRSYYCKYLNRWIEIKKKYELEIDPKIIKFYKLAKCRTQIKIDL